MIKGDVILRNTTIVRFLSSFIRQFAYKGDSCLSCDFVFYLICVCLVLFSFALLSRCSVFIRFAYALFCFPLLCGPLSVLLCCFYLSYLGLALLPTALLVSLFFCYCSVLFLLPNHEAPAIYSMTKWKGFFNPP